MRTKKNLAAILALTLMVGIAGVMAGEDPEAYEQTTISIDGMTCGGCVGAVKIQLKRIEGVKEYKVSLDVLFRVLQVFGMNIGEFFDEPSARDVDGEAELLGGFRALSGEAQAEVLDYVRFKLQQDDVRDADEDAPAISSVD